MSIRARLALMCLVVALLPAIPLTLVVQSLIDKSFNVGLNDTMEDALKGGATVSRDYFEAVRRGFEEDVWRAVAAVDPARVDSTTAVDLLLHARQAGASIHGVIVARGRPAGAPASDGGDGPLDAALAPFATSDLFRRLCDGKQWQPVETERGGGRITCFVATDRSMLLASWRGTLLFYHQFDPFFLHQSNRMIEARQLFAKLRLTQGGLSRSFFLAFVVIYGVCLLLALGVAMVIAERLADPVRRLARGADAVAAGDWSARVDVRTGGETGRLVEAFNGMVERLDAQRRRLVETEKMAAWRDVARHLAHEIKNPILPIRLTIEELRDQYHGDDSQYRSMLSDSSRVVGEELDHLQALVKEFSAFARMPELAPDVASLADLVRDVSGIYPQMQTTLWSHSDVPNFPFDVDQMRRVVINLYDNAIHVGGDRMAVEIATDGTLIRARFADNGPGVSPEHLEKVFEPYFTTRGEGSGLGLAVLKNIVLLHGGSVAVRNGTDGGAVFTLALPIAGPPTNKENHATDTRRNEES